MNFVDKTALIASVFSAFYVVLKVIVFLTPENRKNLCSNVSDIKSIATSNKKLFVAVCILLLAVLVLIVSFLSKVVFGNIDIQAELIEPYSVVEFGGGNEKIEWIVIEKNERNHYLTLLSKNCLKAKPYHQDGVRSTKTPKWEKSTLRSWLNGEFLNKNFSESDQSTMINDHGEFITLLEEKQAKKLKDENKDWLVCHHASAEKADEKSKGWWLKTPGKGDCVMFVDSAGKIWPKCTDFYDNRPDRTLFVRPVIKRKI